MQKQTEVAEFRHRALLIKINQQYRAGASVEELYETTRYCWRINKSRAEKAEVILAVYQGEIKAAFIADEWLATTSGRFYFNGHEASSEVQELYVGKRVPDRYTRRGVQTPTLYTYDYQGKPLQDSEAENDAEPDQPPEADTM